VSLRLRHILWIALALLLGAGAVLAATGCGDRTASSPDRTTSAPAARGACVPSRGDRMLGDALLHVPRRARAPLPLVIVFHGGGGTGPVMAQYTGLSRTADRHGFAVLYPTAASSQFWSLNRATRPDDIVRLRKLLPRAMRASCADRRRVYATGVSNGGGFTARVGCELAGTVKAIAPVAGTYGALDACPGDRRTSVLEIHGTADDVVPYTGRGKADPQAFVAAWAARNGCAAATVETRPRRLVHRFRHLRCPAGFAAEHIRLDGTDHGWPGAARSAGPPLPRRNPSGLKANGVVWRFFKSVGAR
jgi:polyhydroxybutyrate depolymerase